MNIAARSTRRNKPLQTLPPDIVHFDALPSVAFVRQPVVQQLFCCSAASLWRHVKSGLIPRPHQLAKRISAWNVGELRLALAKKLEVKS